MAAHAGLFRRSTVQQGSGMQLGTGPKPPLTRTAVNRWF